MSEKTKMLRNFSSFRAFWQRKLNFFVKVEQKIIFSDFRNTEKELEMLKTEIRERNDLINSLQNQNEMLQAETQLYDQEARVPIENLLNL